MTRETSLQFAGFRLEPDNARPWRGAHAIKLKPKAFAVLHYSVEHAGQLVTKDELWQAVWPDVTVSDDVLTARVRDIRKALGDDPKTPRLIETVHRRGYRFIASITTSPQPVQSSRFKVSNPQSAIRNRDGGQRSGTFATVPLAGKGPGGRATDHLCHR
ncbi:MAG: winged helix-turn-helix domain-containing protein [Deltaproteobacteria bacterium]|nr:winged helix-turn-helix domain-containing protein [Deltaproteobacteria bacterium]